MFPFFIMMNISAYYVNAFVSKIDNCIVQIYLTFKIFLI